MKLDETIEYAEKVAKEKEEQAWETQSSEEYMTCKEYVDKYRQLAEWLKELKQLREQTKWVSCSERMPEEHEWIGTKKFGTTISDKVYVTFENPEGKRFVKHIRFENGKLNSFDQSKIDAFHMGSVPIAWQPLPIPYKGETE